MSLNTEEAGSILTGKVTGISKFGAFVTLESGKSGLVHISEISNEYVQDVNDHLKIGQEVTVKIVTIDDKGRLSLSIKKAMPAQPVKQPAAVAERRPYVPRPAQIEEKAPRKQSFEDMMSRFKQESDERSADIKTSKENRKGDYGKRNKK